MLRVAVLSFPAWCPPAHWNSPSGSVLGFSQKVSGTEKRSALWANVATHLLSEFIGLERAWFPASWCEFDLVYKPVWCKIPGELESPFVCLARQDSASLPTYNRCGAWERRRSRTLVSADAHITHACHLRRFHTRLPSPVSMLLATFHEFLSNHTAAKELSTRIHGIVWKPLGPPSSRVAARQQGQQPDSPTTELLTSNQLQSLTNVLDSHFLTLRGVHFSLGCMSPVETQDTLAEQSFRHFNNNGTCAHVPDV